MLPSSLTKAASHGLHVRGGLDSLTTTGHAEKTAPWVGTPNIEATASTSITEQTLTLKRAQDLLSHLQKQSSLSSETVDEMERVLDQCKYVLRSTRNMNQPLVALPSEIIGEIMLDIAEPLYSDPNTRTRTFWTSETRDHYSSLNGIAATCRRFYQVARALPDIRRNLVQKQVTEQSVTQMGRRTLDSSRLNVYLGLASVPTALGTFYALHSQRIRELHLAFLRRQNDDWERLLRLPCPNLRSLSITASHPNHIPHQTGSFALGPSSQCRNITHLLIKGVPALPTPTMSSLTHLALVSISLPLLHRKVFELLTRCPSLQVLVLRSLRDEIQNPETTLSIPANPPLQKLTRFTISCPNNFYMPVLCSYLALVPPGLQRAIQVLDFPGNSIELQSFITSRCPAPTKFGFKYSTNGMYGAEVFSVTTVNSDNALHASMNPSTAVRKWNKGFLVEARHFALQMREVWVDGLYPYYGVDTYEREEDPPEGRQLWERSLALQLRWFIMSSPTLETMTVVFRPGAAVNLHLLPNMRHPSFMAHKLKTIRLVICHGFDGNQPAPPPKDAQLDLLELRQDLATGKFQFLETMILQVGPRVSVDLRILGRLRKYVPTVKVERITAVPAMELPDFCTERDIAVREEWLNSAAW